MKKNYSIREHFQSQSTFYKIFIVVFVILFGIDTQAQVVCGPINTLYQTVGNATLGVTEIYRYNNFQQSYIKVGQLPSVNNNSAPNSAYNATTQYVYSNFPTDGGSVVRVYNPATNYSYVGSITVTGNTQNFNNTLFAQGNYIGFVSGTTVVRVDITGIVSYPATRPVIQNTFSAQTGAPNDYSLIGNEIYGVTNSILRIINLTTNIVTNRTITFNNSLDGLNNQGTSFGATWQDRFGNFYFFSNGSGAIYKIANVVNPGSTVAEKILLANPSGQNDGFGCEIGPDPLDWDEDGISNNIDIDDDNDGILDINESGGTGLDPGGNSGLGIYWFRNVTVPGFVDVNLDGINDMFDFDLDGVPDAYDLDSDNDGIPDNIEGQPTVGYITPSGLDSDNDGLDNNYEFAGNVGLTPPNTDGAGNPDFLDVDADDDGLYDTAEAGLMLVGLDTDGDGLDDAVDAAIGLFDPNGTINDPTLLPNTNAVGDVDYRDAADIDLDGVQDVNDLDDDNDGILDTVEYGVGLTPFGDEDGDGIFNFADAVDNGTGDGSSTIYTDTNADGIPDAYDFDLDGIVNHLDTDSDGDGCNDANEAYGSVTDTNNDGTYGAVVTAADVNPNGTVIAASYAAPVNLDSSSGNTALDFLQVSEQVTGILTHPTNQATAAINNVTFNVVDISSGIGTPEIYQWQEQVNGVGAWNNIIDGGVYSGATTATLTIAVQDYSLDGNNYRAFISTPSYICDADQTSNAAVLTVTANAITANADSGTVVEGQNSVAVTNVVGNDNLVQDTNVPAGITPTIGSEVNLSFVSSTNAGITLDTATGNVNVASTVPFGSYTLIYTICETANTSNCTNGTVTITVLQDTDRDGIPNITDFDDDNDGILDSIETNVDSDGDGITNDLDLDSDNDGIYDAVEAGHNQPQTNGVLNGAVNATNGIPSIVDDGSNGINYSVLNSDSTHPSNSDLIYDFLDNDSDGDNCNDANEAYGVVTDTNNDGTYGGVVTAVDVNANGAVIAASYATPVNVDAASGNLVLDYLQPSIEVTGFSVHPLSLSATPIQNILFTATETTLGVGTAVQYQWEEQVNGSGPWVTISDGGEYSGTTTQTLTVSVLNTSHNNSNYHLVVSSPTLICNSNQITNPATLTITNNLIVATYDNGSAIEGTASVAVVNVLANDDLAGSTPTTATVNLTQVSSTSSEVSLNPLTGEVNVTALAAPGIYTIVYQICETASPLNCITAEVMVTVADAGNPIAVDDSVSIAEGTLVSTLINAIGNDTTVDGTTYSMGSLNTAGTTGAVTDNGDGTFGYIPAVGFSGIDTFSYTICDNDLPVASCSTATVTVIVTDEGNPIAVDDSVVIAEGTTTVTSIDALANDTMVDNATYTIGSLVYASGNGATVIYNAMSGEFEYTPAVGFSGLDTFSYTICDNDLPIPTCSTATITVIVADLGNPIAVDDSVMIAEGTTTSTTINAVANDNMVDGATYSIGSLNTTGTTGAVTDNGDGTFGYIPAVGFSGLDTFTYTICDNDLPVPTCSTATVTVIVADLGNPIAVDDSVMIAEGTLVSTLINAVVNDNMVDGASYSLLSLNTTGTTGAVTDNGDGTFGYIPAVGFSGLDTFTYTICDNDLPVPTCSTATVTVIVTDEGNPIAVDDSVVIAEGTTTVTSINALANDSMIDNATYTLGSLVYASGNGATVIYNAMSGEFEYTPAVGFSGIDTFTYTICDDDLPVASCSTATVTVIVTDEGSPIAVDDSVTITEDTLAATIINVFTNDSLTDNATINSGNPVSSQGVTVINNNDGTFSYIPPAGFAGTDTFSYTICDDDFPVATCSTATVFVTVLDQGDPFAYNDSGTTVMNIPVVTVNVLANDIVVDDATITSFDLSSANGGTVSDNGGGTFLYTPPTGYFGLDTFTYTICDDDVLVAHCSTATVTILVTPGVANLVTVKTVTPPLDGTYDEGDTFDYTLTVTNIGPNNATGVSLTDLLPAGVSYVSDSGMGSYNSGSGLWTIGNLAVGSTSLTIMAKVNVGTSNDNITNFTTAAKGDQSDPNTANDVLSVLITVANNSEIVLTKTVDQPNPNVGDIVTYTVTVTNTGAAQATNLVITDTIDTGLTITNTFPSAGAWNASTGEWTIGTLDVGVTETIMIQAVVGVGTSTQTLTNTVSNTQTQTDLNLIPASVAITVQGVDLVTEKFVDVPNPSEGDTVTFTIDVTNNGPSDATGVSLTDLLPVGVTYVSHSTSQGTYNQGSGLWKLTDGIMSAGNVITNGSFETGDYSGWTIEDVGHTPPNNNLFGILPSGQVPNGNVYNFINGQQYNIWGWNGVYSTINATEGNNYVLFHQTYGNSTQRLYQDITIPNNNPILEFDLGYDSTSISQPNQFIAVYVRDVNTDAILSTLFQTLPIDSPISPILQAYSFDLSVYSGQLVRLEVMQNNIGSWLMPSWIDNVRVGGMATTSMLASGDTATLTITATVNAGTAGQTITNFTTAAIGDQEDLTTVDDVLEASITVGNDADIVLTKTVDNATPNVGDTVTYTVTVTNNGPTTIPSLTVTDDLAAITGITEVAVTPSTGTWTTPNWSVGSLAPGVTETLTIEATVDATSGGSTITNTVTKTHSGIVDLDSTTDTPSVNITVTSSDLVTVKTVTPPLDGTYDEGDTFDYTLTVTNIGPNNATGVSLTDLLPAGVSYVSDSGMGAYNSGSGLWTIGNLAVGSTSLTITAKVNAGTSGQTITNATTVAVGDQSDPTTVGDVLTAGITVNNATDIVLTKVVNNATPNVGDTVTYTVTVTNNGPATIPSLIVTDDLAAITGITEGAVTPSTGTWTSPNWSVGSLAPGVTETLTIEATVDATSGGSTITNTVTKTHSGIVDLDSTTDTPSVNITVTSSDLVTVKTVNDASPNEGDIITYTITVTNNGPSDATSVNLTDNLPVGVTYVSHSTVDGTFNNGSGIWSIGNLTSTGTATLTVNASVDAGTVGQTITNTTNSVTADQSDPNISNNIGSVSIVPVAFIDLSLTKTIVNNITAPLVGDQITFEIRVNNEGPTNASGVEVTDLIPSGYQFVNYSSTIGTYNPVTGLWSIGNIEIGNIAVLLVDVKVLETGDYTNCAEVSAANETDIDSTPNSGNDGEDDYACATTIPLNEADLSITKTVVADNTTPLVESIVTFEIRITNNGPVNATEVMVTDLLPSGYTFVNYSSTIGTYNEVSGLWTVGKIVNGDTEVLLIDVSVNATGDYTNCTSITNVRQIDPVSSNNSDCALTEPISIIIPELFTPNNDGTNDTFALEFIKVTYPNFSMEIVNRYGNKVYEYQHNGNPNDDAKWWDGYSDGRWNFNDNVELPVGTYFYTIYFNDSKKTAPKTGWIYLRR